MYDDIMHLSTSFAHISKVIYTNFPQNRYALPMQNHIWHTTVFSGNSHMFFLMQEMNFHGFSQSGGPSRTIKKIMKKMQQMRFESMTNAVV